MMYEHCVDVKVFQLKPIVDWCDELGIDPHWETDRSGEFDTLICFENEEDLVKYLLKFGGDRD